MTAVIYARYSSDNQREESIEGQIRECTAYAEKNGITMRELNRRGKTPDPEHYEVTYYADLPAMWQDVPDNEVLEELFQMFNLSRPQDFEGHSLSERPSVLMNLKEKCDAPECNPTVCRKARDEHEL